MFGFVDAFFQPAYVAIVPEVTPADLLTSANALTSLSGQLAGIVGPTLGALMIALGGTPLAFALDGVSFFVSGTCVLPILGLSLAPARKADAPPPNALRDFREGLAAVLSQPWLWITIALFGFINVTMFAPLAIALPLLVKNNLKAGVEGYGLLGSLSSVGLIAATVWLGRTRKLRWRGLLFYGALIGFAVTLIAMGLLSFWGVAVMMLLNGALLGVTGLIWTNTLQEMVPRELLGRVASVDQLGSFALLPVGYAVAGVKTDRLGAPIVFVLGGLISAVLSMAALLNRSIRTLD